MKGLLRRLLRWFTTHVPVRGRHRLADVVGARLAPDEPETFLVHGLPMELDHSVPMYRYVYYGMYEVDTLAHLRSVLRDGDVFLDGGTNVGYVAALASGWVGPQGGVHGFEPSRTCHDLLQRTILSRPSNIVVNRAALSEQRGEAEFADTPRVIDRGYACLAQLDRPDDGSVSRVPTETIDEYCEERAIGHLRYVKLDVEGAEHLALRGARRMLAEGRIDHVLVESHFLPEHAERNAEIAGTLAGAGFESFRARSGGRLEPIDTARADGLRTDVVWVRRGAEPPR